MSQAPGFGGTPDSDHCSSAATRASCANSSARPTSPTIRVRPAMICGASSLHTASIVRCASAAVTPPPPPPPPHPPHPPHPPPPPHPTPARPHPPSSGGGPPPAPPPPPPDQSIVASHRSRQRRRPYPRFSGPNTWRTSPSPSPAICQNRFDSSSASSFERTSISAKLTISSFASVN